MTKEQIQQKLRIQAAGETLSTYDGTLEDAYARMCKAKELGLGTPEDILIYYKYEDEDLDTLLQTIDDRYEEYRGIHNEAIIIASEQFEGDIEVTSGEGKHHLQNIVAGVDYEIGFSRQSILKLKV